MDLIMNPVIGYAVFVSLMMAVAFWLLPQIKAHRQKVDAENKLNAN